MGSSVTLLMYFARVTQSRNWSKHARKMALSTQLQGCDASFRPKRSPNPRQMLQAGTASANVSDLFHSISFLFLATRKSNRVVFFQTVRTKLPGRLSFQILPSLKVLSIYVNVKKRYC